MEVLFQYLRKNKVQVLEGFLLSNLAFLALDIWVAHSFNDFHHWGEWIPFVYCILATLLLLPTAIMSKFQPEGAHSKMGTLVGWLGVIIGLLGLYYHLKSQFFKVWTIAALVYTAPFLAPLAFTGIGFLLIMNRSQVSGLDWHRWVIFFALGGTVGNFGLTLCDHAQNGFFHWTEWIPVFGGAFGVSVLSYLLFVNWTPQWLKYANIILMIQIFIGILGFALHFYANINGKSSSVYHNFLYGAPIFAPLLFANIAALGFISTMSYDQNKT